MIELGMADNADAAIINLQHYIKQGLKNAAVRKRDVVISEVLYQLRLDGYDFHACLETCQTKLMELASKQREFAWEVQSPELIVFHKCFEAKLKGQPYDLCYEESEIFRFEPG